MWNFAKAAACQMGLLTSLWRGDIPLRRAFWEYAVAYGTTANILATVAAVAAVAMSLPDAVAVGLFLIPVPYIFIAVVGVVRSANRYDGPPIWATLARIAALAWGALMILI